MAVVVAAEGVKTAGPDNNQQKTAAGVAKMADVAGAGAEVALAATAVATAAAEAVVVAAAETAMVAAIAMAMAKGKARGRGDCKEGLGVRFVE